MKDNNRTYSREVIFMAFLLGLMIGLILLMIQTTHSLKMSYSDMQLNEAASLQIDKLTAAAVIQDSLLRIYTDMYSRMKDNLDHLPIEDRIQNMRMFMESVQLTEYYIRVIQRYDLKILAVKHGQSDKYKKHYYHRYKSFFDKSWDGREIFADEDIGLIP